MNIDETLKNINIAVRERISSPLMITFMFSWGIWNYKFLMILLSENTVSTTLKLTSQHSFNSGSDIFLSGLLFPALSALLFIYAYPIPAKHAFEYWRKRQRELTELQKAIDNESLLSKEESISLKKHFADLLERQEQEHIKSDMINDSLRQQVRDLTISLEEAGIKKNKSHNNSLISSDEYKLLQIIAEDGGSLSERRFLPDDPRQKLQQEFLIGELIKKKLLEKHNDPLLGPILNLTHDGRGILLSPR